MNHINSLVKLVPLCALVLLMACNTAPAPTIAPTVPPQIIQVLATPTFTPLPAPPTVAKTIAPTATPFITPPANGDTVNVPILMYHHLEELPPTASELLRTWTVAPQAFDEQMNWLAQHGYHSIAMAQLVGHLTQRQPLPTNPVIISFDDGWEDQYTVAFPILKKYGLRGTFFVYTNAIDHKAFLSWAQLQEMTAAGMDIQSHSLTHPHLRDLNAEQLFKELADSKMLLEKRLGKPVVAFNYPFGEYNSAVIEMVKRAGYASAVTIAGGYKQRADDLFTLHRIRVTYADSLDDVIKRLPK